MNDHIPRDRMTVRMMIEALSVLPPDAPLFTSGYEGGYEDATTPTPLEVSLNVNKKWYYGPHDKPVKEAPSVFGYLL